MAVTLESCTFGDGRGGSVSGVIARPNAFTTAVVLAHGAGNDMSNPLLSFVHEQLAARGFASVKFNFPYKQRGGRVPDPAPVLETCYQAVVEQVRSLLKPRHLVLGGKSLGGRMASHLAAQGAAVSGLLFLGYPLHPAGQPEKLRAEHLKNTQCPMLFVVGTRDPLCSLDLLHKKVAELTSPVSLHVVEGGDHSFELLKKTGASRDKAWRSIVDASVGWLESIAQER